MNRTKMDGRLLTLVALLALTGTANAWDISLELQRDALYQPGDDSSYVPGVLLLEQTSRWVGLVTSAQEPATPST